MEWLIDLPEVILRRKEFNHYHVPCTMLKSYIYNYKRETIPVHKEPTYEWEEITYMDDWWIRKF